MGFQFSRVIQQYIEIKTEAYYSNCNIQLSHNTNMIPITSLYTFSITTMGIADSGKEYMGWSQLK